MKSAASGSWTPPDDGGRSPAGEVHVRDPGRGATAGGVLLRRAGLTRFPHVDSTDLDPLTGGSAGGVRWTCPTCRARGRSRVRTDPRP